MEKKIYVIKGECNGVIETMGGIKLTQEEFNNRDNIKWIQDMGNELLADTFPTGFFIEEYDGEYGEKSEEEIGEYLGMMN